MTATLARKHVRLAKRGEKFLLVGKQDKRERVHFRYQNGVYTVEIHHANLTTIWSSEDDRETVRQLQKVAL